MKVLPESLRSRLPDKDDEARNDIVTAARGFLKEIMAPNGRRTDLETSAFWAAAVAMIPVDVVLNRKGRAVHRLLGVGPRVISKATEMRTALADRSKRWLLVTTASHGDVSDWHLLWEWLHSDEASHEDNTHKELVRVDRVDLAGGQKEPVNAYEQHRARTLNDTKQALYVKFMASQTFTQMADDFLAKKKAQRLKLATIRARVNSRRSAAAVAAAAPVEVTCLCRLNWMKSHS
jgi:phage-related protein